MEISIATTLIAISTYFYYKIGIWIEKLRAWQSLKFANLIKYPIVFFEIRSINYQN